MSSATLAGIRVEPPGAATAAQGTAAGSLGTGNYIWRVTFVTVVGETTQGTASSTTAIASPGSANLTAIPVGGGNVTARKIYRTAVGGSTFGLVTTINDNTTTTYTDVLADGSRGAAPPVVNTAHAINAVKGVLQVDGILQSSANAFSVGITALAGGTLTTATPLLSQFNNVSVCATNNDSVVLPPASTAVIGQIVTVRNMGVATLAIFAQSTQTVDGAASVTLATTLGAIFLCSSATAWVRVA